MSTSTQDWGAMNKVAFIGCNRIDKVDYSSLLWYAGILWAFYGVIIFLSPFKLFPIDGMMKYAWMRFEAGMKPESREKYGGDDLYENPFVATMTRFAGIAMLIVGLFHIWAADDHPNFDFFTVVTIFAALQCIIFFVDLFRGSYKIKMAAGWGLNFLAILGLSIAVLATQKNDEKQLLKFKSDDDYSSLINGTLLYLAIFSTAGAINIWMMTYKPFEFMGPNLYLIEEKQLDDYLDNVFIKSVMRLNAMATSMISVYFWWAAMNYNLSQHGYGQDFPFLMAVWVSYIAFFIWCLTCFVANPNDFEAFAIFQAPFLVSSLFAVILAFWHVSCYA